MLIKKRKNQLWSTNQCQCRHHVTNHTHRFDRRAQRASRRPHRQWWREEHHRHRLQQPRVTRWLGETWAPRRWEPRSRRRHQKQRRRPSLLLQCRHHRRRRHNQTPIRPSACISRWQPLPLAIYSLLRSIASPTRSDPPSLFHPSVLAVSHLCFSIIILIEPNLTQTIKFYFIQELLKLTFMILTFNTPK